jgi:hypothetical protein
MTSDEHDKRNPYAIKDPEINTGRIVRVDEGWLLNPQCTAPITLLGSTFEAAQAVKRVLEQSYSEQRESVKQLAVLIGMHGLVFKELRHTLEAYRMRCYAEFEKLKANSLEYREAFANLPVALGGEAMTSGEIRQLFRQSGCSLKQFSAELRLSYSAVASHFGGRKTSVHIHEAAEKKARELKAIHRQDEVLSDLRFRAEELAGVPPTAAEALPIWDGEADAIVFATQIVERFRRAATLTLHDIHRIDPGGVYGTLWKIHGPTDVLTCAECRELMEQKFKSNEIPVVPVHPGCRCTVILDTSELERENQQDSNRH